MSSLRAVPWSFLATAVLLSLAAAQTNLSAPESSDALSPSLASLQGVPPEILQQILGTQKGSSPAVGPLAFTASSQGGSAPPQPSSATATVSSNALKPIPLLPYIQANNLQLPHRFLLLEQTLRIIAPQAVALDPKFGEALQGVWKSFTGGSNSLNEDTVFASLAPSIAAPLQYANGTFAPRASLSPSGAPTPSTTVAGVAPAPAGMYEQYQSVDLVYQTYIGENGTFLEVSQPSQLASYVAVAMLRAGYQIQALAMKLVFGPVAVPLVELLPLKPVYILETVLSARVHVPFQDLTIEEENIILTILNSILGSQQSYQWNVLLRSWLDPDIGVLRMLMKTYVSTNVSSIDAVFGDSFVSIAQQKLDEMGIHFNLSLVTSKQIGTFRDEYTRGLTDLTPVPTAAEIDSFKELQGQTSSSSTGLSGGAIAGIVIGCVTAVALLAVLAVLLLRGLRGRHKRQRNPFASARKMSGFWDPKREGKRGLPCDPEAAVMDMDGFKVGQVACSPPGSNSTSAKVIKTADVSTTSTDTFGANSGSSGEVMQTSRGPDSGQELAGLASVWNINPKDITICTDSLGKDIVLGTGTFGRVVKGLRNGLSEVAIKRLVQPDMLHLKLFQREISIMRALNYDRHIVQFYGACLHDDNLMLVQELMEGGDLRDALGGDVENRLGWYDRGAYLLMDILRGLHFLHKNKCVHRDLKTKNILLTAGYSQAKIADVGLAKLIGSQLMSSYVDAAGTFAYAAPELLMGDTCDTSADIFSFGVVMWEVVTHEVPIRGNLRPIKVPDECPQAVVDLLESCWKTAEARPTAREVFERIREAVNPGGAAPLQLTD